MKSFFLLIINLLLILTIASRDNKKIFIVYLGDIQHNHPEVTTRSHIKMLELLLGSKNDAIESMIYSYRHGFSGFAAYLLDSQAKELSEHPDVIQITQNHHYELQTTRTYDYLGLYDNLDTPKELLRESKMGEDVIIGIFDTGVWPESESFKDEGLGPIPTRWKGKCVDGQEFDSKKHCNKKLIGAKYYKSDGDISEDEFMSARDSCSHGTHVASTAGGSFVSNASYRGGFGQGTMRGGAPKARIAMYKVCWKRKASKECSCADILKAMDEAVNDGVDAMSLSLGSPIPLQDELTGHDDVLLGAFHAVLHGITVLCSAGNDGPGAYTVSNIAPWIINVAATTQDRWFTTPLSLGNNVTILASNPYKGREIRGDLMFVERPDQITSSARGKVVLAFDTAGFEFGQQDSSAQALIIASIREDSPIFFPQLVPTIYIDYEQGTAMLKYIRSTRSPSIRIGSAVTLTGTPVATKVAAFSSRGPNSVAPYILKPDIAAPGVGILAACSPLDKERCDNGFAVYSGTSMATPVVAGVVVLLRAVHPDWSPAAIRSALVTTASTTDPHGEPIFANEKLADPFDFGGGLVNPTKAADPGLVFDASAEDYMVFLCASGFDERSIAKMSNSTKMLFTCPTPRPSMLDLNTPSITVPFLNKDVITVTRTVTNVGPVDSIYKLIIVKPPMGVQVFVTPKILLFNNFVKKLSFQVSFSSTHKSNSIYYFGSITWTNGFHVVTIPLSVRTQQIMYFNY